YRRKEMTERKDNCLYEKNPVPGFVPDGVSKKPFERYGGGRTSGKQAPCGIRLPDGRGFRKGAVRKSGGGAPAHGQHYQDHDLYPGAGGNSGSGKDSDRGLPRGRFPAGSAAGGPGRPEILPSGSSL